MDNNNCYRADLRTLRMCADTGPYAAKPNAPAWLVEMSSAATRDAGVLALLGPSGINVSTLDGGRDRAIPDPTATFLSGLAGQLQNSGKRVALACPPSARHLPLLIASSTILGNAVAAQTMVSAEPRGVLVVSPDLDIRSKYCDLYVRDVLLDDAFPGSRMRPDGTYVALRAESKGEIRNGVCFFLPNLDLPKRPEFRASIVMLDLRFGRWIRRAADLAMWAREAFPGSGVLAIYTLGDGETAASLCQANYVDLPIDHTAVATCRSQTTKAIRRQRSLTVNWWLSGAPDWLERSHDILEVPDCTEINESITSIARFLQNEGRTSSPTLDRAHWLLAVLTQLPVPVPWYEATALEGGRAPLQRLIANLGSETRFNSASLGPVIQTLRAQLTDLYQKLAVRNPRGTSIISILLDLTSGGSGSSDLLVLVRDRITAKALRNWLQVEAMAQDAPQRNLEVRAFPEYWNIATFAFDQVLVNGAFPRRYRWAAGASLGTDVTFLGYPFESDIIEGQLRNVYDGSLRERNARRRTQAYFDLIGRPTKSASGKEADIAMLRLRRPERPIAAPKKRASIVVTDPRDLAGAWHAKQAALAEEQAQRIQVALDWEDVGEEDSLDQGDAPQPSTGSICVQCLGFEVHSRAFGHGKLWLEVDRLVECVRPSHPDDIVKLQPNGLETGDVLLRIDENGRADLFDQVLQLVEGQPEANYLSVYRKTWQRAVQAMAATHRTSSGIDFGRMLNKLCAAGATVVSEAAVRAWVNEWVIGPESLGSIAAVGRVSGVETLVDQAKEFHSAFRRIRSIHQSIGRRLSEAIRRSFKDFAVKVPSRPTAALDRHLALPLDELVDSIDLAEVLSVDSIARPVAINKTGRVWPL